MLWRCLVLDYKIGGVSIKGHHDKNQDKFMVETFEWGSVIVVSDGLGSKKHSEVGSRKICEKVIEYAKISKGILPNLECFLEVIHQMWKDDLFPYHITDCYATCLIGFIGAQQTYLFQLGDGFVCAVDKNYKTHILIDNKIDRFVNETDCLDEILDLSSWRSSTLETDNLLALVLSTDGMNVGSGSIDDIGSFCCEFHDGYRSSKNIEIEKNIFEWLSEWPGNDDKTIVFAMKE